MATKISLEKLLDAGAHYGHQARRWNPKMAPYLYGVEDGVHVFDLTKTRDELERALAALREASKEGKVILFVGAKKQAKDKTKEVAEKVAMPYVSERWLGGTITNWPSIKKSIKKLAEMKAEMASGGYAQNTKKERLLIEREIARLTRYFGGIAGLNEIPDMLIVVDTHKEWGAIREAKNAKIPIVGLVDSNGDPTVVDYPIPMNDDAEKALEYVLELMGEAILEGRKQVKKAPKKTAK